MSVKDYYVTSDAVGSVITVLDSDGNVLERRNYDVFGGYSAMPSDDGLVDFNAHQVDVGFQGQIRDEITGLYQMGYRWLNPSLGRWLSRDPSGLSSHVNLCSSFNNAPNQFTDPAGLVIDCPPAPEDLPKERVTEKTSDSVKVAVGAHVAFFYQQIIITKEASIDSAGLIDVGHWDYATAIYLNADNVGREDIAHEMVHARDSFEILSEIIKSLNKRNGIPCNKKSCIDLLNALQVEHIKYYQLRFQRKSSAYHLETYNYQNLISYEYTNNFLPSDVKLESASPRNSYLSGKSDVKKKRQVEGDSDYTARLRKEFSEKNLPIIDEAIKRSKERVERLLKDFEICMSSGR